MRQRVLSGSVGLEFGQVGQQFVFFSQAREVVADHLVSPQRRFSACPQTDQHAGDDGAIGLNLDALRIVAQQ
jgi:hypothetical protein